MIFRFNQQTNYAIRMLISLAKREIGMRASTSEIRQEMIIPHSFAQHIIAKLAKGAFVQTFPGRDGGVALARPAKEITLRQLLEFFENDIQSSECKKNKDTCPFTGNCPICVQKERLQKLISDELELINFEDLVNESKYTNIVKFPV
ncbi:MAG: Rrf2 family transcriptional regulator [Anaerolineales bacterium]